MTALVQIIVTVINDLFGIVYYAMFIRAILSWVMPEAEGFIINVLYGLTDPPVNFVRGLLKRFGIEFNSMIDLSFLITAFLIYAVRMLLQAIFLI